MMNPDVIGISREIKGNILCIKKWPEDLAFLHKPSKEVESFDEELHQNIADMFATLDNNEDGIALAANQVGIMKRIFVARIPVMEPIESMSPTATPEYEESFETFVCVNPKIVAKDYKSIYKYNEGCLSIPGYYKTTSRLGNIELEYQNSRGNNFITQFQGFAAFAIQHEMDHLDGKLFIDGYSKLKLNIVRKKVKKKPRKPLFDL